MNESQGYIKLYRSIFNHWLWQDKPFSRGQAFVDLILLANYKDRKELYKDELIVKKRGDVNLSIIYLEERWGWSRNKVTRFLSVLENDEIIKKSSTFKGTIITVLNYEKFQSDRCNKRYNERDNQRCNERYSKRYNSETPKTVDKCGFFEFDGTAKVQQKVQPNDEKRCNERCNKRDTVKESKESKEDIRSTSTVPTFPEIDAFVTKNHLNVDARKFYDFYASRSWQTKQGEDITDWKALVMNWHSTERHSPPQPKDTYSLLPRLTLDDE